MKMWMFNCQQISRLVSESMDRKLPLSRRLGIRFHLLMCRHCARFEKQLHYLRRLLRNQASSDIAHPSSTMDEKTKERLRTLMTRKPGSDK